jgi:hypothetical protein
MKTTDEKLELAAGIAAIIVLSLMGLAMAAAMIKVAVFA